MDDSRESIQRVRCKFGRTTKPRLSEKRSPAGGREAIGAVDFSVNARIGLEKVTEKVEGLFGEGVAFRVLYTEI